MAVLAACSTVLGGEPNSQTPSTSQLIRRLGSESFTERQAAASALLGRGIEAYPEIASAAAKDFDFEVRLVCRELLGKLAYAELETRLAAFVASDAAPSDAGNEPLSGWNEFRRLTAETDSKADPSTEERQRRLFFAEMMRQETALLQSLSQGPQQASVALTERTDIFAVQEAQQRLAAAMEAPSAAALLLAAHLAGEALNQDAQEELALQFSMPGAEQSIMTSPQSGIVRKLMDAWLRDRSQIVGASDFLQLAHQYDLPEAGLGIARRLLKSGASTTYQLPDAILTIGRFGDKSDAPLLTPLLANDRLCHTLHRNDQVIRIEIRDVALAILWHLHGEDPRRRGFGMLQPSDRTLFAVYSLGFESDEQREAAHRQWPPPAPTPPPEN